MQILGRKVIHNLVILENMQDKILGKDFIIKHALSYNALSEKCFWEISPIDSGQLWAAEQIHIDVLS
jgi:hypothetical protein